MTLHSLNRGFTPHGLGPKLMVGVPTGFLSPQIPPPTNQAINIGVEIAPGLGISLDGRALLVGHKCTEENLEIIGHLPDGTYPQRDFKVAHRESTTSVDGMYAWQDYAMTRNQKGFEVKGETDRESFRYQKREGGFDVLSKFSGKTFHVQQQGETATVTPAWEQGRTFTVTQSGDVTTVDSGVPEMNYTLTKRQDGSQFVDGQLLFQDFVITKNDGVVDIKGYYPQQHFVVKPA